MNQGKPEVGDYVICYDGLNYRENEFIKDKIGKIIDYVNNHIYQYWIIYDNIPDSLRDGKFNGEDYLLVSNNSIKYWSNDREELESILNTNN